MSAARTSAILIRLYPAQWRERYGDELAGLIVETSGGNVPWRVRLDVAAAGVRERGRSLLGWSDHSPRETVSSALATVLWAWLLVVVGGCVVAKTSEHWQAATPAGSRAFPTHAFEALTGAAIAGSVIVVAGAALALPDALRGVGGRDSGHLRSPFVLAIGSAALAIAATIGLVAWAHGLTTAQRNGHDGPYSAAFVVWVVLVVGCLTAWTRLGARLRRSADIRSSLLRVEAWLAAAAAVAMALITAASLAWWAGLGNAASNQMATWPLVVAGLLMIAGTVLAACSAGRALRAAPALRGAPGR